MHPRVPTCDSEPSTDDKAGSPYEHPPPRRLPRPVSSLVRGWAIRVITRGVGGSGQHIETVGVVLYLDKVGLEPGRMCLILLTDPGGRRARDLTGYCSTRP